MTGDHRFEEAYGDGSEGGPNTMCDVLDRVENRGKEIGKEEGAMNKARETALNLKEMGLSDEMIAKAVNVSITLIKKWLGVAATQ